jgi:hypothetical protein
MRLPLAVAFLLAASVAWAANPPTYSTGLIRYSAPPSPYVVATLLGTRTGTSRDTMDLTIYVPVDSSLVVVGFGSKINNGAFYDATLDEGAANRGAFQDSYGSGMVFFWNVAAGEHTIHALGQDVVSFGAMAVVSFAGVRDTTELPANQRSAGADGTGTAAATADMDSLYQAHSLIVANLGITGNDADATWGDGLTPLVDAGTGSAANAAKVQMAYTVVASRAPRKATATLGTSRYWALVVSAFNVLPTPLGTTP